MPVSHFRPVGETPPTPEDICLFAMTNFRNQMRRFGIKTDDRRRHMYIIGKTGMGKTTMMENMVFHDIYAGHGVGIVDPHGDYAEKIIDYIPAKRINDVVYFNPADIDYPIGFNILEVTSEEQKHLVAAGLMGIFKKIWPDVWSSRMEYILNNTILALLDFPGTTLLGINRLLADKAYRRKVVRNLKDPVVKAFWQSEFASYSEKYAQEAVAPIQNKIGQFLSASVIRNMVAQVKSTINVRDIMDSQKIFIMNLSKGRIGEDNSRLLGGMLITELQLAAMARVDTPEAERRDFFLYVDEFQNFATPSFANILSEARKYRLSLIMAHQYVAQLDEIVADAVFGNVGSIISFRVGGADAEMLAKEYMPTFIEEDIVNLAKYQIFLKLMIDSVASQPFSAMTLPPIGARTGSAEKVIKVSRERYAKPRASIEDKIMRWSGMGDLEPDEEGDMPEEEMKEKKPEPSRERTPTEKPPQKPTEVTAVEPSISLKQLLPEKKETSLAPEGKRETVGEERVSLPATPKLPPEREMPQMHKTPMRTALIQPGGQAPGVGVEPFRESASKKRRRRRKNKKFAEAGLGREPDFRQPSREPPPPRRPLDMTSESSRQSKASEQLPSVSPSPMPRGPGPMQASVPNLPNHPKPVQPDQVIRFDD